jgi:hypothetical protein
MTYPCNISIAFVVKCILVLVTRRYHGGSSGFQENVVLGYAARLDTSAFVETRVYHPEISIVSRYTSFFSRLEHYTTQNKTRY